jgi:MoxR-like ATPase
VSWGAGLRAPQSLVLGAKARALLAGRFHATPEDVRALVHPTLRHRVLLGYRAEADGVTVDAVIDRLLEHMKGPLS